LLNIQTDTVLTKNEKNGGEMFGEGNVHLPLNQHIFSKTGVA